MDNCIYSDVVEQLNERALELRSKAEALINNYENEIKAHNIQEENCLLKPVIIDGAFGLANLRWFDNIKKEELNNCSMIFSSNVHEFHMTPWFSQLVKNTEEGFATIRKEIDFLISIFKKVNYWNKNF